MESANGGQTLGELEGTNEPWGKVIEMVGHNQRVLEVGCRSGELTAVMAGRGCDVVGIERDPAAATLAGQWASDVLVLDLDVDDFAAKLEGREFDVLMFGDSPEHLRDPSATLSSAKRLLAPGGFAVLSLANIAHVDLRLALLDGRFECPDGLGDQTPLRFFTRESIVELLHVAGFVDIEWDRVIAPAFTTDVGVDPADYPGEVIDRALSRSEAETQRFVVRAVADNGDAAVVQLSEHCRELSRQVADATRAAALARGELDDERAKLKWWMRDHYRIKNEWARLVSELDSVRSELEATHRELDAARDEANRCEQRAVEAEDRSDRAHERAARASAEIEAVYATKTFRLLGPLRRVYSRIRSIDR